MTSEPPEDGGSPESGAVLSDAVEQGEVSSLIARLEAGTLTHDEQVRLAQAMDGSGLIMTAMRRETFSGPIPPAEHLNQYDESVRQVIVQMARDEQVHAHAMREKGLDGAISKDRRGQLIGGSIALTGLVVAAVIAPYSAVAAAIIGTLDLFGMVALFVAPRVLVKRNQNGQQE